MNDKILYYPYINAPDNAWFIQSLLYWDTIGMITPQQYVLTPSRYENFTLQLLQSGLIEQVLPYEYVYQIPNFDSSFIDLVNDPAFHLAKRQQSFKNGYASRIHIQKFGEVLVGYLVEVNIARKIDWEWYNVEPFTANKIMIYLASIIGQIGSFTPATDKVSKMPYYTPFRNEQIRQHLLHELIPFPVNPDLSELRRFKDKYQGELRYFRILLEQVIFDTSVLPEREMQDEKLRLKIAEINERRTKIYQELTKSKTGKIVFGTIMGIGGAIYSFAQNNHLAGMMALFSSIYSALQGYGDKDVRSRDFAYLALLDRNLISG